MTPAQSEALRVWGASVEGAARFDVCASGRRIESTRDVEAMLASLDRASSLSASVRTFQVIAFDAQSEELARTECKVDPRAGELARANDRELATREASATAQVIAASDHRVVAATIKTLGEQTSESHNALLGMVSAFGKSGSEMMVANAAALKATDERAARAESRLSKVESDNDTLRAENRELLAMLREAISEAERAKKERDDLVSLARGVVGPKLDSVIAGFAANAAAAGVPMPAAGEKGGAS